MTENLSIYQRIQADLRKLIENSPEGTRLPAEPKLAKDLGVSRASLREAMRILEIQGIILRKQGSGTFVVKPNPVFETGLDRLESIETLAKKIHLSVSMGDLEIKHVQTNRVQAEKLNLKVGEPVVEVRRVIHTKNIPVAYLIDVLPQEIIPLHTFEKAFSGSVLDFLIHSENPILSFSKTEVSAMQADGKIARTLKIQTGEALLLLSGVLFNTDGQPIDFSHSYLLPGYFRLQIVRKVGFNLT